MIILGNLCNYYLSSICKDLLARNKYILSTTKGHNSKKLYPIDGLVFQPRGASSFSKPLGIKMVSPVDPSKIYKSITLIWKSPRWWGVIFTHATYCCMRHLASSMGDPILKLTTGNQEWQLQFSCIYYSCMHNREGAKGDLTHHAHEVC